jgi:hypothetical protein
MDIEALSKATKIVILSVFLFCGCAGPGRGPLVVTDRPSPDVRLSSEMQLMDVPVRKMSAAIDQDGRIHVLALVSKPPKLHHLVIDREGVLNREVLISSDSYDYDHLDIAFDGSGNLHTIVDGDHFVLEKSKLCKLAKDPCVKLIRGSQDLFCLSRVEGKDVGAPGDWDWYFGAIGGGYPPGVCCWLFPWHSHPDKLVLARRTPEGWSKLALLDVEKKFEIKNPSIAADKSGTLHVLYKTEEGGSVREEQCAYARIEPMISGNSSESIQSQVSHQEEPPRTLAKVSGRAVISRQLSSLECIDIAADPETGTVLLTVRESHARSGVYRPYSHSHIVERGKISREIPMYDFDDALQVEPGGGGRFLALGVWSAQAKTSYIYYLEYRDNMWSAPVELARDDRVGNVVLVSDLDRRAFALWTDKDGRPVARWIER